jgi:hypothetical protein
MIMRNMVGVYTDLMFKMMKMLIMIMYMALRVIDIMMVKAPDTVQISILIVRNK